MICWLLLPGWLAGWLGRVCVAACLKYSTNGQPAKREESRSVVCITQLSKFDRSTLKFDLNHSLQYYNNALLLINKVPK
jgi:hypothetical protein